MQTVTSKDGTVIAYEKWSSVTVPTLVIDGGASPAFMHHGAQAIAQVLPHAQQVTLAGQDHGPAAEVLVPVLVRFLADG